MPFTRSEVEHIAALVRLGLTEEEIETLRDQLSQILDQFEVLRRLDTSGVTPTGHAGNLETVMRDDITEDCLPARDVLLNAPRIDGASIRVNAVLDE